MKGAGQAGTGAGQGHTGNHITKESHAQGSTETLSHHHHQPICIAQGFMESSQEGAPTLRPVNDAVRTARDANRIK